MIGLIPTEREYNFTKDETFGPGESINQDVLIDQKLLRENISVSVDSEPPSISLNARVIQPDGKVIINEVFVDWLFTTFTPQIEGEYNITVTNIEKERKLQHFEPEAGVIMESGSSSLFENGSSSYPFVDQAGAGIVSVLGGIILLIAGGIGLLIERIRGTRKRESKLK